MSQHAHATELDGRHAEQKQKRAGERKFDGHSAPSQCVIAGW
jgi:hypothetical protein